MYKILFNEKHPDINLEEYFKFIEDHSLPEKIKYQTSYHHILPKWAFPEFKTLSHFVWNGAHLYHADHLEAHAILARCWPVFQNTITIRRMCDTDDIEKYQDIVALNNIFLSENNKKHTTRLVREGLHNFQSNEHKETVRVKSRERISAGTHNFSPDNVLKKHGVSNVMQVTEIVQKNRQSNVETLTEKYGVSHNWSIPGAVKASRTKAKETVQRKYGVDHYNQTPESRLRLSNYTKENNPMSNQQSVLKKEQSMIARYGVAHPSQNPEIKKRILETRKANEDKRPKLIWIKHNDLMVSTQIRENLWKAYESFGFVKGRGMKNFSPLPDNLLTEIENT